MTTPGSTYLHVVYAGRGDAFYLEYTTKDDQGNQEHVLVLLDGGPMKSFVRSRHNAPYYKYFLAVGEDIWNRNFKDSQNPRRFSPMAIINSHPHDDHLDGLLFLLRSSWNKTVPFHGPFIVPYLDCHGSRQIESLLMGQFGFVASYGCETPGISFFWPSPDPLKKAMLSYNHPGHVHAAPLTVMADPKYNLLANTSVDTSSENLSSILMETNPQYTVGEGRMFFTGDSIGHSIWDYAFGKHFTVYKIQHHGSLRNVQFQQCNDSVWKGVIQEFALYSMLQYLFERKTDVLPINPPSSSTSNQEDSDNQLMKFMEEHLESTGFIYRQDYLAELWKRHQEYLSACVDDRTSDGVQLKPFPWAPQAMSIRRAPSPVKVMHNIYLTILKIGDQPEPLSVPYGSIFYELKAGPITRSRLQKRAWVEEWVTESSWSNPFHCSSPKAHHALLLVVHGRLVRRQRQHDTFASVRVDDCRLGSLPVLQ